MFENKHYYVGTSYQRKNITLELAADSISIKEHRKMLEWLKPGVVGFLQFDSEDFYGYYCVISSLGDSKKYVVSGSNPADYEYLVQFTITFETVENYAVSKYKNIVTAPADGGEVVSGEAYNIDGFKELVVSTLAIDDSKKRVKISFYNRGDLENPFIIYINNIKNQGNSPTKIELKKTTGGSNETVLYIEPQIPSTASFDLQYDSLSGIVFSAGGTIEQLVLQDNYVVSSKISKNNVFISPISETDPPEDFELVINLSAEVVVSFDKKTYIV